MNVFYLVLFGGERERERPLSLSSSGLYQNKNKRSATMILDFEEGAIRSQPEKSLSVSTLGIAFEKESLIPAVSPLCQSIDLRPISYGWFVR